MNEYSTPGFVSCRTAGLVVLQRARGLSSPLRGSAVWSVGWQREWSARLGVQLFAGALVVVVAPLPRQRPQRDPASASGGEAESLAADDLPRLGAQQLEGLLHLLAAGRRGRRLLGTGASSHNSQTSLFAPPSSHFSLSLSV